MTDTEKWQQIDAALSAMPGMDHDTPPTVIAVDHVRMLLLWRQSFGCELPSYVTPEPGGGVIVGWLHPDDSPRLTLTVYNTGLREWDLWRDGKFMRTVSGTFQSREV
jgi:hypothetical protein